MASKTTPVHEFVISLSDLERKMQDCTFTHDEASEIGEAVISFGTALMNSISSVRMNDQVQQILVPIKKKAETT